VTTNVLTGPVPSVEVDGSNRENSHTGWTNPRGLDSRYLQAYGIVG
jgi:hypothetical protein